uniref:Uncharacterized protein n=1 Tax=Siphoviridae sp. cttFh17 TaxID=2826491 RepID=A0A8S5NI60_9CAUD|nr:MAG TPA: hypothetical protein [Siphoviridae sp. cttFh17]DAW05628.1 MAG TPA: hypothetical protein [Caudoviricetes sp.]
MKVRTEHSGTITFRPDEGLQLFGKWFQALWW